MAGQRVEVCHDGIWGAMPMARREHEKSVGVLLLKIAARTPKYDEGAKKEALEPGLLGDRVKPFER